MTFEFSIFGFGRLGAGLARSLSKSGGICTGVVTSDESKLDDKISGMHFKKLVDYSKIGQFCFICVPDDIINEIATNLSKQTEIPPSTHFVHVSGTRSSQDLDVLKATGHQVASFHPLQTFHSEADIDIFRNILVSIEGDEDLVTELFTIAKLLGSRPLKVTHEQKKAIHIAAVFVSNFQSSLVLEANKVIGTQFENSHDFVRQNFSSLMQQTVLNISEKGFPNALTGPAARDDQKTIRHHIDYLEQQGLDSSLYDRLSQVIRHYINR